MSSTNNESSEVEQARPMQIGTPQGEVANLIDEIAHSGVANSPAQVEKTGVLNRDHDTNRSEAVTVPIITSD